jgi:hypothetical protein
MRSQELVPDEAIKVLNSNAPCDRRKVQDIKMLVLRTDGFQANAADSRRFKRNP